MVAASRGRPLRTRLQFGGGKLAERGGGGEGGAAFLEHDC